MIRWFKRAGRRLTHWMWRQTGERISLQACADAGRREGWTVDAHYPGPAGAPQHELRRLDAMPGGGVPPFRCDVDAWRHVVERARAGSLPHRVALRTLDPAERALIETHCGPWSDTAG
jgi:hypothetical protein